ncbi:protein kinase [Candidatus Woesearchaeota archaeon]|nr:protein kinase [Candidatus Woesearchaeota archaeon]
MSQKSQPKAKFKPRMIGGGGMSYVYQSSPNTVTKFTQITEKQIPGFEYESDLDIRVRGKIIIINKTNLYRANSQELFLLCTSLRESLVLGELESAKVQNVPRVKNFYFGMVKGHLHCATIMDLAEGEPTNRVFKEESVLPDLSKVLADTAQTLLQLSEMGIVHRDIKPNNIVYKTGGRMGEGITKVVDFGIASRISSWPSIFEKSLIDIVEHPLVSKEHWGTSMYLSPESANYLNSSPQTDWFALGLTAYQLLAGRFAPLSPDYPFFIPDNMGDEFYHTIHFPQLRKYDNFQRDILKGILYQSGCPKDLAEAVGICLDQIPERRSIVPLKEAAGKIARLEVPFWEIERYNRLSGSGREIFNDDDNDSSDSFMD